MLRDSHGSTQQESQIEKRKRVGKRRKLSEIVKRWEETIEDCARVLPVRGKASGIQGPCNRAYSGIQWQRQWDTGGSRQLSVTPWAPWVGVLPPAREGSWCHHQGLIVIFLSSHLSWSEQALALPPTSQAGIKV